MHDNHCPVQFVVLPHSYIILELYNKQVNRFGMNKEEKYEQYATKIDIGELTSIIKDGLRIDLKGVF
ncbi:hypothetical protein D0463_04450 [Bacillus sp. V59.32b]|nr:hypothetical protein D0463_04450 [Bacillus sp. V59.32b]